MNQDIQSAVVKKSHTRVRRHAGRPRKNYTGLAGQKRNSLTAKGKVFFVKEKSGITYAHIRCVCECGRRSTPRVANFLNGNSKTCDHAARNRFISYHEEEAAKLPSALVEELGDTYYPKGATDYPDKHRRRHALASMNNLSLATFDFVMRNYRQMKGWEAKYVIRPKARQRRVEQSVPQEMKDHALLNILYAKEGREYERKEREEVQRWRREHRERERGLDYKQWRRERELQEERFSARELHNPGSKVSQKAQLDFDSLDFAWHWMKTSAPHMKLDSDEQDLLKWFRETGERTFQWRRDNRIEMARRQSEKRWNDIEAAA